MCVCEVLCVKELCVCVTMLCLKELCVCDNVVCVKELCVCVCGNVVF